MMTTEMAFSCNHCFIGHGVAYCLFLTSQLHFVTQYMYNLATLVFFTVCFSSIEESY